jgi:hypothetical protein
MDLAVMDSGGCDVGVAGNLAVLRVDRLHIARRDLFVDQSGSFDVRIRGIRNHSFPQDEMRYFVSDGHLCER